MAENRPSTNLVENQKNNMKQPEIMNNTLTLPPGFEFSNSIGAQHFEDSQLIPHHDELIEENVDGEESKESLLSQQSRVHGASIIMRGAKRESKPMTMLDLVTASENDDSSQVETNIGAFSGGVFNSRQRVSEFNNLGAMKPQQLSVPWGQVVNGDSGIGVSSGTLTRGNDSAQTATKTNDQTINNNAMVMNMTK